MAFLRIDGPMIQPNLDRFGVDLSIDTDFIYFDVNNKRLGINNDAPVFDLDINGETQTDELTISSTASNSLLFTSATNYVTTTSNLTFDGNDLELLGNANISDISIIGADITSNEPISLTTPDVISLTTTNNDILITTGTGDMLIDSNASLIIPVGNTTQRPSTPSTGAIRYNIDVGSPEIFDGNQWSTFSQEFVGIVAQNIIPNGTSSSYLLDQPSSTQGTIVSLNGVIQSPVISYNIVGSTITFSNVPENTDIINIRFLSGITQITALTNALGSAKIVTNNDDITFTVANATKVLVENLDTTFSNNIIPSIGSTYNLGSATNKFNDLYIDLINTSPADLAENFSYKGQAEPGTVMVLNGDDEVQPSTDTHDHRVAGIVTTDPAMVMNSDSKHPTPLALAGRTPCKVLGKVQKGDLLVSAPCGRATKLDESLWKPGVILGKAIESTDEEFSTIMVLVTLG